MYRLDEGERGAVVARRNNRGLAYWSDGKGDDRILLISPGYQLIALNARHRPPIPAFGKDGIVDLCEGLDRAEVKPGADRLLVRPPSSCADVVVVGAALQAGIGAAVRRRTCPATSAATTSAPASALDLPHHSAARRSSGTTPGRTIPGNTPATPAPGRPLSADEELGYVYMPVETPTGDFYGGHRLGNNLFGE